MTTKQTSSNQKRDDKAIWRKQLFDFLPDFSVDKIKEQLNDPKYVRVLVEDICGYFDDLYLDGGKNPQWVVKDNFLSPEEWEELKEFHNFFYFFQDKLYKDDMEYPEVLSNPDFIKLCTLAQKALTGLKALQEKSV